MSSKKRSVLLGIFTDIGLTGSKALKQLLFVPIILCFIGSEDYGDYLTIIAYAGFYGLLDFNFGLFLSKELAKSKSSKDELLSTGFIATFFNALFILIVGLLINYLFSQYSNFEIYLKFKYLFIWLLITKIVTVFSGYFSSLLLSVHKMAIINNYRSGLIILEVLVSYILFKNKLGINSLIYSELLASIILMFLLNKSATKFYKLSTIQFSYKIVNKAIKFSLSHYLIRMSNLGLSNLDSIIIHYFLGPQLVSLYNFSLKLPILISREIGGKLSNNIFSSISSIDILKISDKTHQLLERMIYVVFRASFLISISLFFINKSFVQIWVGNDFFYSDALNYVFCFMVIIEIIYFFLETFIVTQTNIKTLGQFSLIELAVNFILSIILIKYFGLFGVALASLLSKALIPLIYVILKVKSILGIQYPGVKMYRNIILSFITSFTFIKLISFKPYMIILVGLITPFLINIILEDFQILIDKKISIKEKLKQLVYGTQNH